MQLYRSSLSPFTIHGDCTRFAISNAISIDNAENCKKSTDGSAAAASFPIQQFRFTTLSTLIAPTLSYLYTIQRKFYYVLSCLCKHSVLQCYAFLLPLLILHRRISHFKFLSCLAFEILTKFHFFMPLSSVPTVQPLTSTKASNLQHV